MRRMTVFISDSICRCPWNDWFDHASHKGPSNGGGIGRFEELNAGARHSLLQHYPYTPSS